MFRTKFNKLIKRAQVGEESDGEEEDDPPPPLCPDDHNAGGGGGGRGPAALPKSRKQPKDPFEGVLDGTDIPDDDETAAKPHDKEREEGLPKIGEKSFLGDGHNGSPRHLAKLAMNALTIVSELGRPTFFLTLTCNQLWPEVQCRLFAGQSAFDREDIIDQVCGSVSILLLIVMVPVFGFLFFVRSLLFLQVFKGRLDALLHNLRSGKYFGDGRIAYMMRVIEYQHRGLPHAHIVFQMTDAPPIDDKLASTNYIDKFVPPPIFLHTTDQLLMCSCFCVYYCLANRWIDSEMPVLSATSTAEDERYLKLVTDYEVHKCYSKAQGEKGCLDDHGKCARGYTDDIIRPTADFDAKGFPLYKRPAEKDLRITPHHRGMLLDWGAHLNLEFCGSTYTALYLYNYLFKGNKKVKVQFDNTSDVLESKCTVRMFAVH